MSKVRLSWVTGLLVLAILTLTIKGVQAKRDAEIAASQVAVRQDPDKVKTGRPTTHDLMLARKYIESFALSNDLPLRVSVSGPEITITSAPETIPDGSGKPAEQIKEDKEATLSRFNDPQTGKGILNFLSMVAEMKYRMSYKSICIGSGCNAAFEMVLTCDGIDGNKDNGKDVTAAVPAQADAKVAASATK